MVDMDFCHDAPGVFSKKGETCKRALMGDEDFGPHFAAGLKSGDFDNGVRGRIAVVDVLGGF